MILKIQPTWEHISGDKLQQLAEKNLGLVSEYGKNLGENNRFRKDFQEVCEDLNLPERWVRTGNKSYKVYGDKGAAQRFLNQNVIIFKWRLFLGVGP